MAPELSSPTISREFQFRQQYETLRSVLNRNGLVLQILSDLEADLNHLRYSDLRIRRPVQRLLDETLLMVQELNLLSQDTYETLYEVLDKLRLDIKKLMQRPDREKEKSLVVPLDGEEAFDSGLVGGKAAGVALLRRNFPTQTPQGFVVTTRAYELFIHENKLFDRIRLMLRDLEVTADRDHFQSRTEAIRQAIRSAETPASIREAIQSFAEKIKADDTTTWAVRSSAVSEDGRFSFAGQFDSILNVKTDDLVESYQAVLASRFSERAITYRLNCGFREVDTPMAVLFMPMIEPVAAGVLCTIDPQEPDANRMTIDAVPGLADKLVKGTTQPDTFHLTQAANPEITKRQPAEVNREKAPVTDEMLQKLGETAWQAKTALGYDLNMEWAVDKEGQIWLLQGRRLHLSTPEKIREDRLKQAISLIQKGITIFPGRAEGVVVFRSAQNLEPIPKGAVLLIEQPTPEMAPLLNQAAAVLAAEGSPVGHLATLLREFAIPSIFQLGQEIERLRGRNIISIDATKRKIYEGSRWPGMKERVLSRLDRANRQVEERPLYDRVLSLNLIDPFSSAFKPKKCQSIHDVIRFIHEMSVRSMFHFGDQQSKGAEKKTRSLKAEIPMKIYILDLDNSLSTERKEVWPPEIESTPFQAFWKGLADPKLAWPNRWEREFSGMPKDFQEQVLGGSKGPRRRYDPNYLIFARDYLNFNARFAYHYAMVDALVGEGDQNNYVHFRFHNGGGSDEKRQRRARFLERVLRECKFGVDRQGDLITARLRNYPQQDSLEALELLGRLMVCSRQFDLVMTTESTVKLFTDHFLAGNYKAFS